VLSAPTIGRRATPQRTRLAEGRLTLTTGDSRAAAGYAPADLVLACHVLYFWPDPVVELRRIREVLAPAGHIALGH
jgi:hypothetical protein